MISKTIQNKIMKIMTVLALLISAVTFAQTSGNAQADELIKQIKNQQKSTGTIKFTVKGKSIKDIGTVMKVPKGLYLISSSLMLDDTPDSSIQLTVKKIESGNQSLNIDKNNNSFVVLNEIAYEIHGTITLKVLGKIISGSFQGELFEIKKNNAKAASKSSGKISGEIKNLSL